MTRRRIPYRVLLPLIFGLISAGLIAWAVHEDMACRFADFARPFWPCKAPRALLNSLSVPGITLFSLLFRWWHGYGLALYLAELPFVLAWWWFAGTRLDFGLLGTGQFRWRRTWICGLSGIALVGIALIVVSLEALAWRRHYPGAGNLPPMNAVFLLIWLVLLIVVCIVAVIRLRQGKTGVPEQSLVSRPNLQRAAACGLVYALTVCGIELHTRSQERRLEAEYARHQISVEGQVVDEAGVAIKGIGVQLVPVFKSGDARWAGTERAWTDEHGNYRLTPQDAGEYLLGSMIDEAPYASQPFLTVYYPGVSDAASSTTVKLVAEQHVHVSPMRLRRLPLVRIPVTVVWQDGRPEPAATILFQNPLFPDEAGIGSASVSPDEDGRVPLPANYDYFAVASAQCDAGTKIESRETERVPLSTKADADLSRQIQLMIKGPPCKLWHAP